MPGRWATCINWASIKINYLTRSDSILVGGMEIDSLANVCVCCAVHGLFLICIVTICWYEKCPLDRVNVVLFSLELRFNLNRIKQDIFSSCGEFLIQMEY